jgi:serine/threonine protein kinase
MTVAPVDTEAATFHARASHKPTDTIDNTVSYVSQTAQDAIKDVFYSDGSMRSYGFASLEDRKPIGEGAQNIVFKIRLGDMTSEGLDEWYSRIYIAQWLDGHGYTNENFRSAKLSLEQESNKLSSDGKMRVISEFYKMRKSSGGSNPFENREAVALVSRDRLSPEYEMGKWLERSADVLIGYYHPAMVHSAWTGRINNRLVTISEYVPTVSLSEFRRIATIKDKIDVINQIAVALTDFEKHNFVHRDIKPDNILIEEKRNGNGHVKYSAKLADFGIAKVERGKDFRGGFTLTCTGQPMGTPAFMSPEVAEDGVNVDFRTDMFSLGATLYNLMTSRIFNPALPRDDAQAGVLKNADLLYSALYWDVRPPRLTSMHPSKFFGESGRFLYRKLHPRRARIQDMTLQRIEDIVCAACQYDPEERYPSWQPLRQDLEHFSDPSYNPKSDIIKARARKKKGKHAFYAPLTSQK